MIHSPIVSYNGEKGPFDYYDKARFPDTSRKFDLVLVDGPPAKLGEAIRGGFLPLFGDMLAPGCHIFLDDYKRVGERGIVLEWVERGYVNIAEEYQNLERGAAHLIYRGMNTTA